LGLELKLLEKQANHVSIVASPGEEVLKGDYLLIDDLTPGPRMLVQVVDETYLPSQATIEDIVRDQILKTTATGTEYDPLELNSISSLVRDLRLLHCKIRGVVNEGRFTGDYVSLPSRVTSKIHRLPITAVTRLMNKSGSRNILIGSTLSGEDVEIFAEDLDGSLTIITGKKESGKSHLAKLLVSSLAERGANSVVFDLNEEYSGLAWTKDGSPSTIYDRIIVLRPGQNLSFSLDYLGLSTILSIFQHVLDIPSVSLREFIRVWNWVKKHDLLSPIGLEETLHSWRCNELVKDALISRLDWLISTGLLSDAPPSTIKFEEIFYSRPNGLSIIVSLRHCSSLTRRVVVEIFLSKIVALLERNEIPPIFLFAEEAHLYLRDTYWDDLITRMRHFGVFTTLITNQPDAIAEGIYRQADNIFLFNFTNDLDLELISRASTVDSDTIKSIVRTLPKRSCLVLGKIVSELPIVVKVCPSKSMTLGETKYFFRRAAKAAAN
jgi:hypothetical protein